MIYAKTALGLSAVKDRSAGLSQRQRSAFIMFDGKRDASEVLRMTTGIGVTQSDVDHLVSLGLLASAANADGSLRHVVTAFLKRSNILGT